jgi:hypothetical protein
MASFMKKFATVVFLVSIIWIASVGAVAYAAEPTVYLNGERLEFEAAPVILDNRVLVPAGEIVDALGGRYVWHNSWGLLSIYPGNGSLIQMGGAGFTERTHYSREFFTYLDVAAHCFGANFGDRVFVPVRAVAEIFGAEVEWDGQSVRISLPESVYVEISVSNAEEFVAAIGSNRTIHLAPGVYDLNPWIVNPMMPVGGQVGFNISGVNNLNIVGGNGVYFTSDLPHSFTILVNHSNNVTLRGIVFKHPDSPFFISRSSNITFADIEADRVSVWHESENILFDNAVITGNADIERSSVVFTNSNFSGASIDWRMFDIFAHSDVRIENSIISSNVYNPDWEALPLSDDDSSNPYLVNMLYHLRSSLFNLQFSSLTISETHIADNVFFYAVRKCENSNITHEDGIFYGNRFDTVVTVTEPWAFG